MKKLIIALVASVISGFVGAKGIERISVVEHEIVTISVPFGIKTFHPSNMDVVRVEELSTTSLRVTALRRGRCDLEVHGDNDLSQMYELTVMGDLAATLDTLTSELDQVQEVRARLVGDFIRIDGEINAIQKWEYLQKVLRHYPEVRNFATFAPGPDVMLRLKETLQDAGFKVVFSSLGKDRKHWPINTIALVLNKQTRILTVQGRVYTPDQCESVAKALETERWLKMDHKAIDAVKAENGDEYMIRGVMDVYRDRPQIRVSVAYMAIGDSDVKHIGNASASVGNGVFNVNGLADVLGGLVHAGNVFQSGNSYVGGAHTRGTYNRQSGSIGATLDVTARFLKNNGISRVSDTGYTVMESWEKEGAIFKSGGTMYARSMTESGSTSSSSTSVSINNQMQEINYGFTLKTVGGLVPEGDSVDMAVEFEISSIAGIDQYGVDKKEEKSKQKLILPIGKTTFIGGRKMIDDSRTSPSGLPILRNTPMLNWFVADSGTEISDRRLVIMLCPELVDNTAEFDPDVTHEINIPVSVEGVKPTEQREEEMKKYHGVLYPLNWFTL